MEGTLCEPAIDENRASTYLRGLMRNRGLLKTLAALLFCLPALSFAQHHDQDAARNRPGDFVINRPASLYMKPSADTRIIRVLRPRTIVRVVEVLDQWYRIRSAKGRPDGYVRRSYADPYGGGGAQGAGGHSRRFRIGVFKLIDPVVVRAEASSSARKITTLRSGAEVRIVDKDPSGLWYKVESETGRNPPGWIPTQAARRVGDVVN